MQLEEGKWYRAGVVGENLKKIIPNETIANLCVQASMPDLGRLEIQYKNTGRVANFRSNLWMDMDDGGKIALMIDERSVEILDEFSGEPQMYVLKQDGREIPGHVIAYKKERSAQSPTHNRIERRGEVLPLTPRFTRFLREALSSIALDTTQDSTQRRPDFSCWRDLLVIEVKSLEEDATKRMSNLTEELKKREDWPTFLGEWPVDSVVRNLKEEDQEAVRGKIYDRIGRPIKSHLKKAGKQLAAYAADNPRTNQVRVVVLINEDREVYHPNLVSLIIQEALARQEDDVPKYKSIDTVLYMTARHGRPDGNNIAHPIIMIPGPAMDNCPWKNSVMDFLVQRWCQWEGALYVEGDPDDAEGVVNSFTTIDHIPDRMRCQDTWRLAYRRNPYMRSWTYEKLRDHWDDVDIMSLFAFIKDSPIKPSEAEITKFLEQFTHLLDEIAHRGLPVERFDFESDRMMAAAKRMRIPPVGMAWIKRFSDEKMRSPACRLSEA